MAGRPELCIWCGEPPAAGGYIGGCPGPTTEGCRRIAAFKTPDFRWMSWNMLRPGGWPDELAAWGRMTLRMLAVDAGEAVAAELGSRT